MLRVKTLRLATGETVQLLQRQRGKWFMKRWETIGREHVPEHALICQGCFGDTGGWASKFAKYGSFGRDGEFTSLTAEGIAALAA